jgi:ribosomal protein L7/L12
MAARVKELYRQGDKAGRLQAVKELRAATGLGLADAARIADKLGQPKRP